LFLDIYILFQLVLLDNVAERGRENGA